MNILNASVFVSTVMAAVFASQASMASSSDKCGNEPREKWMSEATIKAKAEAMGQKVRKVEIDDNCYEVYAINADGQRVETYFHPVSGEVVRTKIDD